MNMSDEIVDEAILTKGDKMEEDKKHLLARLFSFV